MMIILQMNLDQKPKTGSTWPTLLAF